MDRNRYAEIMAQMSQVKPLSISGYPSTYTGGFDASMYQPTAQVPPSNQYEYLMQQMPNGGSRAMPEESGGWVAPTSQTAYDVSMLGRNLSYVSPLTGALTSLYGNYLASQVDPNYGNEGRNYSAPAQADTSNYSNEGRNYGGGGGNGNGGGGVATGGNNGDASGGGDRGTRGGFAQGGYVSMQNLQGPNPDGPDDGYGALKDGEYVINDQAVKKYGIELMNAINSGKISKGKLLGLLEM